MYNINLMVVKARQDEMLREARLPEWVNWFVVITSQTHWQKGFNPT